jgi:rubrerythrin
MLNDLVADEIEAINGYEEAKAEIMDTPIAHKDNILDTIDHVEDEEKEHVDELIAATTEIPFDKEEAPAPVVKEPFNQEFPEVEENLKEKVDLPAFDSDVKVGDKIRIVHLEGEDNSYDGKEGTVDHIDSIGQLHGT